MEVNALKKSEMGISFVLAAMIPGVVLWSLPRSAAAKGLRAVKRIE